MARRCERPDCGSDASVSYGFDPQRRVVWLDADTLDAPLGGALCVEHADAMILPLGWWLDDRRVGQGSLFKPAAALSAVPTRPGARTPAEPVRVRRTKRALTADERAPDGSARRRGRAHRPRIGEVPLLPLDELLALADDAVVGAGQGATDVEPDPAVGVGSVAPGRAGEEPRIEAADPDADLAEPVEAADAGEAADSDAEPSPVVVPWMPFFRGDDDLDGLLDARTPLLARAFGHRPGADEAERTRTGGRRVIPRSPRRLG